MNDWFSDYEKIVAQRERQQDKENFAVRLLKKGKMTLEEIAELTELALSEVNKLAQNINA